MIETWLLVFLIVYIRNRFVNNLEKNGVYLYQKYDMKKIFSHWSIYPPLLMVLIYIILEILIFNGYYQVTEYSTIFKQITLLSYFGLVCQYELFDSMCDKYKGKGVIAFVTSPFILAIVFLFVGYGLNYIAIVANNFQMPVFPSNTYFSGYTTIESLEQDSFYILGDHTSKVIILCDTIDIFYSNLSIGDVFVRGFVFNILLFSIKNSQKRVIKA